MTPLHKNRAARVNCLCAASLMGLGLLLGAAPATTQTAATQKGGYGVARTLNIAGEGLWGDITLDPDGKLLYIPRTQRTLVAEAATGKVLAEILHGQGAAAVALAPETGRGFITNNRDDTLTVFDLKTCDVLGKIAVADDPGAIVYDPASKRLLVCCGLGHALVPIPLDIDLKTAKPDPAIPMQGKVDSLVTDGQGMAYVTIKDKDEIAVVDTRIMKVVTRWGLTAWYRPGGIAMDRLHSRLFVACRFRVVVLSATDGHVMAEIPTPGGAEAMAFHDGKGFVTCADGTLAVLGQAPDATFEVQQTIPLMSGAHSMALDPRTGAIYIPGTDVEARRPGLAPLKIQVLEKK